MTQIPAPSLTPSPWISPTPEPRIDPTTQVVTQYTCPYADPSLGTPVFTVQVIREFPHDPSSYTQGLIFRDGRLYESTGLYGQSAILLVELESGEALKRNSLPDEFFGEGMTEFMNRIYQLTYRESVGFIYDPITLEAQGQFTIPTEGWGLDHDQEYLIRSDGSAQLYYIDPVTLQTVRVTPVQSELGPVHKINELEFIEGEIWANIFLTSCIARIDPVTGTVVGWIDLGELLTPEEAQFAEMPNGIAYDPVSKRIFVTGKFWPKLFEVKIIPVE
jgi:glutamine cyclotransferase